jgi:hypothetical protein
MTAILERRESESLWGRFCIVVLTQSVHLSFTGGFLDKDSNFERDFSVVDADSERIISRERINVS